MSSNISINSTLPVIDQVTNILVNECKLPFELVFKYFSTTYLESIGANLKQLLSYSKNETFDSLKNQLIDLNGGYEIDHDGEVLSTNEGCCAPRFSPK